MSVLNGNRTIGNASILTVEQENQEDNNEFISISYKYQNKMIRLEESHRKMDMIYNYMVKNEIKVVKDTDPKEEKVRKTRKDKEGRKYICGACKLGYLSYPALYTHIKTKHEGITPDGTIRGESGKPKKRGRPKRKTPHIYDDRQQQNKKFPKELTGLVSKQNLQIMEQYDIEAEDDFASVISLQYFVTVAKELKKIQQTKLYLLPIHKVVVTFLQNIRDFINQTAMQNFQELFFDFIKFVNLNYFKILSDYRQIVNYYVPADLCAEEQYCEVTDCSFVPVFAQKYIKKQLSADDQMLQKLLIDFCKWLIQMKLTTIRIYQDSNLIIAVE